MTIIQSALLRYKWQLHPSNWILPNLVWLLRPWCIALRFYQRKWHRDNMKYDEKHYIQLDFQKLLPFQRSTSNIVTSCRVTMENNLLCINYHTLSKRLVCPVKKPQILMWKTDQCNSSCVLHAHQKTQILNCLHHRRMTTEAVNLYLHNFQ